MPSKEVYNNLIANGVKFGKCNYEKVDTIASSDDLEKLFEICDSFRDINGNPVIITANTVVANPDFGKIKDSGYMEYFYEPIPVTMERYYPNKSPFLLWKEGMEKRIFHPQFHGREHINIPMWLNSLRENHPGARKSFDNGVFSFIVDEKFDKRVKNTSAYNYFNEDEFLFIKQSIVDGADLFEKLFGYRSKSFIAPAYTWDTRIEEVLKDAEILYIQGLISHFEHGKRYFNFLGKKNRFGQIYLNRNSNFEYSQNPLFDWETDCLKRIEIAFRWNKPVTISTHRLNFVGALNVKNRDVNLGRFKNLIKQIQKKWPNVEFMTSDELGKLCSGK